MERGAEFGPGPDDGFGLGYSRDVRWKADFVRVRVLVRVRVESGFVRVRVLVLVLVGPGGASRHTNTHPHLHRHEIVFHTIRGASPTRRKTNEAPATRSPALLRRRARARDRL